MARCFERGLLYVNVELIELSNFDTLCDDMNESELIQKFSLVFEYLNELSAEDVIFYSDELLPASKEDIKKAALLLSVSTKNPEELLALKNTHLLLEHFIPHRDALRMAQLARQIGGVEGILNESGSMSAAKEQYIELMNKYTSKWTKAK